MAEYFSGLGTTPQTTYARAPMQRLQEAQGMATQELMAMSQAELAQRQALMARIESLDKQVADMNRALLQSASQGKDPAYASLQRTKSWGRGADTLPAGKGSGKSTKTKKLSWLDEFQAKIESTANQEAAPAEYFKKLLTDSDEGYGAKIDDEIRQNGWTKEEIYPLVLDAALQAYNRKRSGLGLGPLGERNTENVQSWIATHVGLDSEQAGMAAYLAGRLPGVSPGPAATELTAAEQLQALKDADFQTYSSRGSVGGQEYSEEALEIQRRRATPEYKAVMAALQDDGKITEADAERLGMEMAALNTIFDQVQDDYLLQRVIARGETRGLMAGLTAEREAAQAELKGMRGAGGPPTAEAIAARTLQIYNPDAWQKVVSSMSDDQRLVMQATARSVTGKKVDVPAKIRKSLDQAIEQLKSIEGPEMPAAARRIAEGFSNVTEEVRRITDYLVQGVTNFWSEQRKVSKTPVVEVEAPMAPPERTGQAETYDQYMDKTKEEEFMGAADALTSGQYPLSPESDFESNPGLGGVLMPEKEAWINPATGVPLAPNDPFFQPAGPQRSSLDEYYQLTSDEKLEAVRQLLGI